MIQIRVQTNGVRETVIKDVTATPASVFNDLGVDISRSMVNLNGATLNAASVNKTFEELGVADGSTANLNSIVKADGAINA